MASERRRDRLERLGREAEELRQKVNWRRKTLCFLFGHSWSVSKDIWRGKWNIGVCEMCGKQKALVRS